VSLHPFVTRSSPRIVCVQQRERLTKFVEPLETLIASLQPREILHQNSDLTTLLQQFAFHSFVIFHVFFFTVFRSHSSMHMTRLHMLQHHLALHLECHNVVTRHCVFRQRFFIFKTLIITYKTNFLEKLCTQKIYEHKLSIISSSTHLSLSAEILMYLQRSLLSTIFFAQ